jgi:hypothetical protein
MRVNGRKVINAWLQRKHYKKSASLWTDGDSIYSYGTCIVARGALDPITNNHWLLFNLTKYSKTTTIYQNSLACYFYQNKLLHTQLANIPLGTKSLGDVSWECVL